MDIEEWKAARATVEGLSFEPTGPVVRIGGERHPIREPKLGQLRAIDTAFWALQQAEKVIIDAAPADDPELPIAERQARMIAGRRMQAGWFATGGYSLAWSLVFHELAGLDIDADDMPAWTATGDALYQLIAEWWITPLARGPQALPTL